MCCRLTRQPATRKLGSAFSCLARHSIRTSNPSQTTTSPNNTSSKSTGHTKHCLHRCAATCMNSLASRGSSFSRSTHSTFRHTKTRLIKWKRRRYIQIELSQNVKELVFHLYLVKELNVEEELTKTESITYISAVDMTNPNSYRFGKNQS